METQEYSDILMIALSPSEDLVSLEFIPTIDNYPEIYDKTEKKQRYHDDLDRVSETLTKCAHHKVCMYAAYKEYEEYRLNWGLRDIEVTEFSVIAGDIVQRICNLEDRYKIDRRKYIVTISSGVSVIIIREDMFNKLRYFCRQ